MADLFAPPNQEELLDRKIEIVGILINRFQEQLNFAATLDPRSLSLQKAEWLLKDLEDITLLIKDIKNRITSKTTEEK